MLGKRISADSGFGRTLAGYARGFAESLGELDDAEACVLVDGLFCLLAAHGEAMLPPESVDRGSRALALRAQRYARASISDPALNVESIARAQRVSARTLQRAFAAQGAGLMRWLRDERLELCAAVLAGRVHRNRSVAEIAASLGFRDTAAFCRSFKARFGCTPSAWRAGRRAGN